MARNNISICLTVLAVLMLSACRKEIIPSPPPVPSAGDGSGAEFFDFSVLVDGKEYHALDMEGTDLTVFVPDGTDLTKLVARFKVNASSVTISGTEQKSGVSENDFSGFRKGVTYHLASQDGSVSKNYTVRVLDTRLPVVTIRTAIPGAIDSKEVWRAATIKIRDTDGSVTDLGGTGIRGRGNWTWEKYPKKPYALKLTEKQKVLGMPAHKRWTLLAQYRGFIGNPMAFEATRRASALGWAPRGRFVELVFNGKFQGLYYLCEQIKIDENRVDIHSLKASDVQSPAVTGGYLLEYDELYDEQYKFKSQYFKLPVQLKSPDDDVPDAQLNYIRDYINEMEAEIKKIGTGKESLYADYLDIDNFADYWMALEVMGNYEAYKPRSVKMYKGRDGSDSPPGTVCKLKAGPLWDQELFLVDRSFNSKDMYYYQYLFKDPAFVAAVKARWADYKSNLMGNDRYGSFLDYLQEIADLIDKSARRDISYWNNGYFTLKSEVASVKAGFKAKINWMDSQIQALQPANVPSEQYLTLDLTDLSYPEPEAVDLGLRVKWASCNLGAAKEYEAGYYFAWGETQPKESFSWADYSYSNPAGNGFSKYCYSGAESWWTGEGETPDNQVELFPQDDAVIANLGGKWRMPTRWELWELWDFIHYGDGQMHYEDIPDASGKLVRGCRISNKKSGKSIFLPSVGRVDGQRIESYGSYGYYWTSSLTRGGVNGPAGSYFIGIEGTVEDVNEWTCGRFYGMPVRPVCE